MILFVEYRCSTYFILVCTYISDDIYYTQLIEYDQFVATFVGMLRAVRKLCWLSLVTVMPFVFVLASRARS